MSVECVSGVCQWCASPVCVCRGALTLPCVAGREASGQGQCGLKGGLEVQQVVGCLGAAGRRTGTGERSVFSLLKRAKSHNNGCHLVKYLLLQELCVSSDKGRLVETGPQRDVGYNLLI